MPPVDKHLHHISQILSDRVPNQLSQEPTQAVLNYFFQSIASDRIRIDRLDWRGHPLRAMLWHLPNLKSAGRTALYTYIVDQWIVYSADPSRPPATTPPPEKSDPQPSAVLNPAGNGPLPEVDNRETNDSATRQNHFFAAVSTPRRDWFDRFTDWVAAVVSLWE